MHEISGIADAVLEAGSQVKLAQTLGVSQQAISKWVKRGWVPLRRAAEIELRYNVHRSRLANPNILLLIKEPVS